MRYFRYFLKTMTVTDMFSYQSLVTKTASQQCCWGLAEMAD